MIAVRTLLSRLRRDERGAMAIETAIVAPVLILMSVGSFQVSSMVARQTELQNAVAEASSIALAKPPQTDADIATIRGILRSSTGLSADNVTVTVSYRCGDNDDFETSRDECDDDEKIWTYLNIQLRGSYNPLWSKLGVGSTVPLVIQRRMQIS